ncbi:hypothetical protein Dsin_001441 [Dipteronia sinensis]|uniref:Peptidase A2 domain-containing protein n=1 Tax=Dipteronia sinensis TaxID=43782 RepID=A0AAE0B5A0_9ROSI|nr:hypothetical protein Dsin_001441 [Dipteronia sinensis]
MTHANAVTSLATGFEGQLFGWWTHTISSSARETIINHTKEIITTTTPSTTFTPSTSTATTTTSQPNGIDVLCYTILMHFVGNPNRFQGKEFSKLQNLKCKKLSDFKWYKDIFLTRVLQRPDNANSYWKEKFISGLPTFFSTKVRDKIVEQMTSSDWSQIDLNTWTYAIDHTSDSDTTSSLCLSDRYPEKQPCICKEINVLDQHDYTMIIGMIDSIEDPSLKAKYLRELQQNISSGRTQQPTISSPPTSIPFSTPDFDSNVIGRFQTKTRKITISDLQKEIQNLKDEIKITKTTISKLEHHSSVTKNDHRTPLQNNPSFASSSDSDDPNIADQQGLTTVLNHPRSPGHLSQIKTYKIQKWYIEIDIRISQDYNIIVNALVDIGADLNCIMEALVPTKYLEKNHRVPFWCQ